MYLYLQKTKTYHVYVEGFQQLYRMDVWLAKDDIELLTAQNPTYVKDGI
jgi:hypothetical protein